ncbi:MAG: hypothetical protein KAI40_02410 [Desulfobacterales bacterium]|nr:hypothetical protein [Desulfobacterales bacterium]
MYKKSQVGQNAKIDAKNNIPAVNDPSPSQFEQEMMAMARHEAWQVTAKYGPRIESLNGRYKPLLKDYERISKDYDKHSAKIQRSEPSVELSRNKYYVLMFLFIMSEIPMNSLAFAVFGESQLFTWVMALGVAVAIPWIAHAMGILLKRGSKPWWKSGLGVGALSALTIGGLIAIGYVRVQYLGDLAEADAVSSSSGSKFIGAAFVGLNLVILAAATISSYFAHDEDPLLENLHRRTNKINKAMRKIEGKHNRLYSEQQQEVNRIHQEAQELVFYYRKINQRERPDHTKPESFDKEHTMNLNFGNKETNQEMLNATRILKLDETGIKPEK